MEANINASQTYSWCNNSVDTSEVVPDMFLALSTISSFVTSTVGSRCWLGNVLSWNMTHGVFEIPYKSFARGCSPEGNPFNPNPAELGVVCVVSCGSGEGRAWGADGFDSGAWV